jgi:hypothetical protein
VDGERERGVPELVKRRQCDRLAQPNDIEFSGERKRG